MSSGKQKAPRSDLFLYAPVTDESTSLFFVVLHTLELVPRGYDFKTKSCEMLYIASALMTAVSYGLAKHTFHDHEVGESRHI